MPFSCPPTFSPPAFGIAIPPTAGLVLTTNAAGLTPTFQGAGGGVGTFTRVDITTTPDASTAIRWIENPPTYANSTMAALMVGGNLNLCPVDDTGAFIDSSAEIVFVRQGAQGGLVTLTSNPPADGTPFTLEWFATTESILWDGPVNFRFVQRDNDDGAFQWRSSGGTLFGDLLNVDDFSVISSWVRVDRTAAVVDSIGFGGPIGTAQSGSAPALATNGTITSAAVGVARVAPASAVTGIVLQSGTFAGQECAVINQSTTLNSITFAASGTSHVASGTACIIAGLTAKKFVWNTATSLWYECT